MLDSQRNQDGVKCLCLRRAYNAIKVILIYYIYNKYLDSSICCSAL